MLQPFTVSRLLLGAAALGMLHGVCPPGSARSVSGLVCLACTTFCSLPMTLLLAPKCSAKVNTYLDKKYSAGTGLERIRPSQASKHAKRKLGRKEEPGCTAACTAAENQPTASREPQQQSTAPYA